MTLLNEASRRPLDPGYQLVADERAAGLRPAPTSRSRAVVVVVAVVLGIALAAATVALRQPATSASEARRLLEAQIVDRSDEVTALQDEIDGLAAEIGALQQVLVGSAEATDRGELAAGAVEAAVLPVHGPGLRIVLTDGAPDEDDPENLDSRVQDVDLQVLVNGLWAVGAEAIAINGERLGTTTAIRSAGSAVLVDLTPLSSPYTVDVVGDGPAMQTELSRTIAGQHLATLRTTFGIGVSTTSVRRLQLPGTGPTALREASVPEGAAPKVAPSRAPEQQDVGGSAGPGEGSAP
jgi:uncharacterized protein YlxW (UPF0749 family)